MNAELTKNPKLKLFTTLIFMSNNPIINSMINSKVKTAKKYKFVPIPLAFVDKSQRFIFKLKKLIK